MITYHDEVEIYTCAADRPAAAVFGVGACLVAGVPYISDGTAWTTVAADNADVLGQKLTGYVSGAAVVAATDTILQAFNKLNGNIAAKIATAGAALGSFTSSALASAVTDETGSGALVFASSPTITTATISESTSPSIVAATGVQGANALTSSFNRIITTSNDPSAVTLPVPTVGRTITIMNKGVSSLSIYPSAGTAIDALSANAAYTLGAGATVVFMAPSTALWNQMVPATGASANLSAITAITVVNGIVTAITGT